MKKNEIKVGGTYTAKVSGQLTTVKVTAIREGCGPKGNQTRYDVVNQRTGRKTTFASAQKFRGPVRSRAQIDEGILIPGRCKNCGEVHHRCSCRPSEKAMAESAPQPGLADRLKATKPTDLSPHLIVEARAGTGKTTTLLEGIRRVMGLTSTLTPSPQQAAVWEAMEESKGRARTICFVAFNKSIADELQSRVPEGCDAMTMHRLGNKACQRAFNNVRLNQYRVQDIIAELLGRDIRELRRYKSEVIKATEELVGLCKMNLVGVAVAGSDDRPHWDLPCYQESLADLASYYDVELNGYQAEVFDLVPRVLGRCKDVARDGCIDFDDMIWLPVALGLPVYKYDLLLVDEAQDLNRCQQALARMAGRRLVLCGDPKQAIYGFAGADAQSMSRLEVELSQTDRGCRHLPLTVTRRCGKAIVAEARKIVPDFEAFETNPAGQVFFANLQSKDSAKAAYQTLVADGDMVLCRCNAPLVSECFRFIKAGRRAEIQGRDVGAGLVRTIDKVMKGYVAKTHDPTGAADDYQGRHGNGETPDPPAVVTEEIVELHRRLDDWLYAEEKKENAKRNPSEQRLINLRDRRDCLMCFAEGTATVEEVKAKIGRVFTDDRETKGIKLSSVHKAKGLEARRVFILMPKESPMPHPMAKSAWEREQEMNIKYVAITRAIEELVFVS